MQVTPESLRTLKQSQQVQKTTLLFFEKAAETPAFIHGKPTRSFFAVRSFFKGQTLESLHLLYDYLWQLEDKQSMTMSDCFEKAREYQDGLRWKDRGEHKGAYEDYRKLLDQM
jgi:hypothetical protein